MAYIACGYFGEELHILVPKCGEGWGRKIFVAKMYTYRWVMSDSDGLGTVMTSLLYGWLQITQLKIEHNPFAKGFRGSELAGTRR